MTVEPAAAPIREDLTAAIERAWSRLASPSVWWDGVRRLAIVAETRAAHGCALCRERKVALSPEMVQGTHDGLGVLPEAVVDVVHRIATDPGRLTERWYQAALAAGVGEGEYIEAVSATCMAIALDTFDRALGNRPRALPDAVAGEARCHGPEGAKSRHGWVRTVRPEDSTDGDRNPYAEFHAYNIQLALGLVPEEVGFFFDLDTALYLTEDQIADMATEHRAISRAQMELIAARGASLNGCHYCATCHSLHLHKLGERDGTPYDLEAVLSGATGDNGVAQGAALVAFTDAVLGDDDDDRLAVARDAVFAAVGGPGLIDAAGTVASFNSIVRMANATGTQLDRFVADEVDGLTENAGWVALVPEDG